MVRLLDEGLRNFAEVIKRTGRIKIDDIPGAGAAGGLGGGFVAFLKAELKPGIRMVLDALRFDERIRGRILLLREKVNWINRLAWERPHSECCRQVWDRISRLS